MNLTDINNIKLNNNKPREIYFIRHGESIGNKLNLIQGHFDTDLTETGFSQAEHTSRFFAENQDNFNIKFIYSSDLKRTQNTAKPISEKLNLELKIKQELRETSFGKWEGRKSDDVEAEDPENYYKWRNQRPWAPAWCESFENLRKRSFGALKQILAETDNSENNSENNNIIIVSHGTFIYSLISYYSPEYKPPTYNCGINIIQINNNSNNNLEITLKRKNFIAPNVIETA